MEERRGPELEAGIGGADFELLEAAAAAGSIDTSAVARSKGGSVKGADEESLVGLPGIVVATVERGVEVGAEVAIGNGDALFDEEPGGASVGEFDPQGALCRTDCLGRHGGKEVRGLHRAHCGCAGAVWQPKARRGGSFVGLHPTPKRPP